MKTDLFIKARTFIETAESTKTVCAALSQFSRELDYKEAIELFDLAIERIDFIYQMQVNRYNSNDDLLAFE